MKAELRISQHAFHGDARAVEVWYAGEMIATVYGFDGPGISVITKHKLNHESVDGPPSLLSGDGRVLSEVVVTVHR